MRPEEIGVYGEPLHIEPTKMGQYLCSRVPKGRPNGEGIAILSGMGAGLDMLNVSSAEFAARVVECVNACLGMSAPEAEIPALRAEVESLNKQLDSCKSCSATKRIVYNIGFTSEGAQRIVQRKCPECEGAGLSAFAKLRADVERLQRERDTAMAAAKSTGEALVKSDKLRELTRAFIAALDALKSATMAESDACIAVALEAEDVLRSALGEKLEGDTQ